jgi:hypothetical protein
MPPGRANWCQAPISKALKRLDQAPRPLWNHNGGRCRHRPPLVPALTAVAGCEAVSRWAAFGLRGGRERPLRFPRIPERGREAFVRHPVGRAGRLFSPPPVPVGSLGRNLGPAAASRLGSSPAEAAPFPQARIEAQTSPVALSKDLGAEAPSPSGEVPRGRSLCEKSLSIAAPPGGFAALPKSFSKAETFSSNPVRVAAGAGALAVSLPARVAGRFPLPSPVRPAFQLARSLSASPWKVS